MTIATVVVSEIEKIEQQLAEVLEQKQKVEAQRDEAFRRRNKAIAAGDHDQALNCLREQKTATDELELLADREKHLRDVAMPAAEKADGEAELPLLIDEYRELLAQQKRLDETAIKTRDGFLAAANAARSNHDRLSTLWRQINSISRVSAIPEPPEFDRAAYQNVAYELNPIVSYPSQ